MLLGGNFQDGWDSSCVVLQDVSNVISNVLIDQNDSDIIPR
jgi:hypothetical protein